MGSRKSTVSQKNSTVIYFARITRRVEYRLVFRAPSKKLKILAIPDVLAQGKSYEHGFTKKCDGHKLCANRARITIDFSCTVSKIKILSIPNVLAHVSIDFSCTVSKLKILAIPVVLGHCKSYNHGFAKKRDGHKLCAKSRAESSFDRFFVHHLGNSKYWPFPTVEFRSVFRAPSPKFKILAIPDVFAHGKSYEHSFTKKCKGHKLYATVKFRSVFRAPSQKFKILAIPYVLAHESSFDRFFSGVSKWFLCTVPKIQKIGHSRRISP
ncbi:hypothetical protein B296_00028614 [Ensete ventricosum]|uniref:Uncharacterized protein n=1 Tax=Ensete ventricosum TaxID=4639 RepID=A0A426XH28_ENSVE|nr:hypothetical protein B296_00028614 [Ensete ventricosum]